MTAPSPDVSQCSRCGSLLNRQDAGSTCRDCMARDIASGDWGDLLRPEHEMPLTGGNFTVGEEIGRGGMGIVYRAQQLAPAREVALKLLPSGLSAAGEGAGRLLAEAEVLARLDHPGILPLYSSGVRDGRPWLAMKLASGGTLARRQIDWQGRWRDIAVLAAELADAVHHAHERGIIHRDLKPGNILFDENGRVYVADFGLAKWSGRDSGLTHTNTVLGTPAYMAPEIAQADGRAATTASDVYGLGALLYFLLCGRAPYEQASTLEMLRLIADTDPPQPRTLVPQVPADLEVMCLKALAREPSARYAGAAAFAADLRRWLAGDAIEARPPRRTEKLVRWVRRHPLSAGLAALLALTVAGSGVMLWQNNRALTTALEDARHSLRAAYSSIGYATREIPPQLEAVGRLDVLDGLFQDVESRFVQLQQSVRHPDSADLVYQAELYAHWSRVLRWRGQYAAARERILQATSLAAQAVEGRNPEPLAWAVQSMAHRLLAEQFTDDEDFAAGLPELDKAHAAVRAGRERFPEDFTLRMEEAEVAHQRCDSSKSEGNGQALANAAREAVKLWAALRPDIAGRADASALRQWRQRTSMPHYFLAFAAEMNGLDDEAIRHARNFLQERKTQLDAAPQATDLMHEASIAGNLLARLLIEKKDPDSCTEALALLDSAEALATELSEKIDPQNQFWRAEWGCIALNRSFALNSNEWRHVCLERLAPAGADCRPYLQEVRTLAEEQLARHAPDAKKLAQWRKYMEAQFRLAAVPPARWMNFQTLLSAQKEVASLLPGGAGGQEEAARQWIAEAQAEAAKPEASLYWAAVEAGAHRRLADILAADPSRLEDARAANRAALRLRAGVLRSAPLRARKDMLDPVQGTCTRLLALQPVSTADARLVLGELTALAPSALAVTPSRDWRPKWESAALLALDALPARERPAASALLSQTLYPGGEANRLALAADSTGP
jgi:serine/threonine protein kinase